MRLLVVLLVLASGTAFAQTKAKQKREVIYEYKKFERFDFDEIGVEGETGAPGDLSVAPTPRKDYGNRLPERRDFKREMRKSASGIR